MEPGDKIVCINSEIFTTFNGKYRKKVNKIEENKIYTVKNPDGGSDDIMVEGSDIWYHKDRFMLLSKYRRMKINKIRNGK